ncbi:AAA family ATPase, partial [Arthrobacter sp.]
QQRVLDAVAAGGSVVVSAPPGTGQTQTALNTAAALAEQGKSVLVVAERRGTLNQFVQELDALNLGSLVLQLNANSNPAQLKDQLLRAIVRNEKAVQPKLATLHETLVSHRHKLLDHVRSLHNVRSRWGCSPYQAMQSLAELTSLNPAPATTVRLKRSVMDSIPNRAELTGRLRRAAELGGFSREATQSPWYGAKLRNRKETEHAHSLAVDLARDIPLLREKVRAVAEHSHIELGTTFEEWGGQLDLLVAVRASLDKFTPDIFDRPVTDLISATAPSAWRRERTIEMSSMTRSRLRRVAKEYIRPGVHISDLHQSLVQVQEQRTLWTKYATTERHPSVPTGLAEINSFYRSVDARLNELASVVADTPGEPKLPAMPLDELESRLAELARDKQSLATLPERTLLLDEMRESGLGELLDDLAAREVGARQVGGELELAWWQSALEAMISGDDYLAMSDGASLRTLEAEYRLADNAHVASGAGRIRWALAERWRAALETMPAEADQLRELLREGEPGLDALCVQADELVTALMPVWAASPLVLPLVLPQDKTFDAVIVLDAESISLQSVVPALARSRQVIAFGDDRLGGPRSFTVSVEDGRRNTPEHLPSAYRALAAVLPSLALRDVYRGVDKELIRFLSERFYGNELSRLPSGSEITGVERALTVEYLPDGTGMPSSDQDGVESVAAEVTRVVDLVFEHIRRRPSFSLAVVTASARHAQRVGEAVRLSMADAPWAADFFKPGNESFRVVPIDRAAGLTRDAVIFSLGFGRTPHGRALHNFGPLSAPDGRGKFVAAMTRARHRLHVLTCFRPEDLDPERLGHGALDFYELLRRELSTDAPSAGSGQQESANEDPLVADLVERLRHRGAAVHSNYDGVLDIVAASTGGAGNGEDVFVQPVAIESDGSDRYRGMTVRERSRIRPQLLERMGWRYMPLWTIEVFTDPEGCAERISGYLGLEEPVRQNPLRAVQETPAGNGDAMDNGAEQEQAAGEDRTADQAIGEDKTADREPNDTSEDASDAAKAPAAVAQPSSEATTSTAPHGDVLPQRAAEDDPRSWNDDDGNHEEWLKEQKPPHWS